jgi:hypothetical protein
LKEFFFVKISAFLKSILFGGGSSIHAKVVWNLNRSYSNFSHHLGQKGTKITIIRIKIWQLVELFFKIFFPLFWTKNWGIFPPFFLCHKI